MTESERIQLLEAALIRYVEMYGFIEEARNYYLRSLLLIGLDQEWEI